MKEMIGRELNPIPRCSEKDRAGTGRETSTEEGKGSKKKLRPDVRETIAAKELLLASVQQGGRSLGGLAVSM